MRKKRSPKPGAGKARRIWSINPRTRIHSEEGYRRSKGKATARRRISEELNEEDAG